MTTWVIDRIAAFDMRFPLTGGAGSDAVHTNPEYSLAVTHLHTCGGQSSTGITLTLGHGNRLVCDAIELLARPLMGMEIDELMADFGAFSKRLADDSAMRWLGPHKGVVHLALASLTNACFDLWAKSRGVPPTFFRAMKLLSSCVHSGPAARNEATSLSAVTPATIPR